ncbi:hypothetical protein N7447_004880 [Penicillium robsamsonii]|uniref:uncharacterized protein n=1 Tax=Penicillium robsamsonii TaxID=1792511 RepID=UPI002546BF5D|nr:uncharacterized protein N7447_004880 [Penicillium robsamsonii]KAJ5822540.1 hypothetical protein N7447_004880 [Penicillium robsamsonii]
MSVAIKRQNVKSSITLAITPPRFSLNPSLSPTITLTAMSHYYEPITLFTQPTIFNLGLSQRRNDFICHDITTADTKPLCIDITKGGKRPGFNRGLGGSDDRFFVTCDPETPTEFQEGFRLANRSVDQNTLEVGHRYWFEIKEGQVVSWWRAGRKAEVMATPGERASLGEANRGPITLQVEGVEFEVL